MVEGANGPDRDGCMSLWGMRRMRGMFSVS